MHIKIRDCVIEELMKRNMWSMLLYIYNVRYQTTQHYNSANISLPIIASML